MHHLLAVPAQSAACTRAEGVAPANRTLRPLVDIAGESEVCKFQTALAKSHRCVRVARPEDPIATRIRPDRTQPSEQRPIEL